MELPEMLSETHSESAGWAVQKEFSYVKHINSEKGDCWFATHADVDSTEPSHLEQCIITQFQHFTNSERRPLQDV